MSVSVEYVAPFFTYLSLSCLFYVLRPLLFFIRFKLLLSVLIFVTFLHVLLSIFCFVICTVSPYL
jgi:hypothetical protein